MIDAARWFVALLLGSVLVGPAVAHDGDPKLLDRQPAFPGAGWRNAQRVPSPGTGGGNLLLAPPSITFPANNVTLLSWLTLGDFGLGTGGNGNSCYGYVAPSGREYALFGHSSGTAFVEITQPGNAAIVAQISGPPSLWRDVKCYSHYAYAVSEGGGGIQVFDLANIDGGGVTLVTTVNDDGVGATHTLAVDPVAGYLYRSGGGANGLRIYDVHTDPANPTRVGTWSDRYVHEPSIFSFTTGPAAGKQIAFCCGGLTTGYTQTGLYVVDVTNKAAPTVLTYVPYPNAQYAHQCWPSADMQWLYLDDELDDRNLGITCTTRVFDISTPAATTYVGTFTNGNTSIDHNLYTRGTEIFESNYRSGLHVYTTAGAGTPTNPVEIASFDTWPEDDGTFFNGLWNNYPYFPSGVVIGSDIEKGLFVWWVGAPAVAFGVPGGVPEIVDPTGAVLRVRIQGSVQPGTALAHVDTGSGFVATNLTQAPNGDWIASVPPTACGTDVRFYFSARAPNGVVWSDPVGAPTVAYVATAAFARTVLLADDFEGANNGWIASPPGDTATSGQWVRDDPIGTELQPENDHTPGGTKCWFTGQGTIGGSVSQADVDGGFTTLLSPLFALAGDNQARIGYWRWYDAQVIGGSPPDDPFFVDVSNDGGAHWTNVETIGPMGPDASGGWIHHEFRVADFVAPTNQVRLRFVAQDLLLDTHVEAAVDDIEVTTASCNGYSSLCFGDGSGAACPCGNDGLPGRGCANSMAQGALLAASGTASIANDTLVLDGAAMPALSTVVYVQGDQVNGGGLGTAFGDGLLCVGGNLVRIATRHNAGGSSTVPSGVEAPLSVQGGASAGTSRYYQALYRNSAAFCTSATMNTTNAVSVSWAP